MSNAPIVDLQQLLDNVGGDEQLADMLLARMRQDVPRRMNELRTALDSGDAEAAHRSSHPLKGGLGSIRAFESHSLIQVVDDAARVGDIDTAREKLPELEEALQRLDGYIQERLGDEA